MAGIDKTYIDGKDYKHYRTWWIGNVLGLQKKINL